MPVLVTNPFYGKWTHRPVKAGSHQTLCGATVRHGFQETWDEATMADRTVAPYLCPRCFKEAGEPMCADCRVLHCERCSQGACTCTHGLPIEASEKGAT